MEACSVIGLMKHIAIANAIGLKNTVLLVLNTGVGLKNAHRLHTLPKCWLFMQPDIAAVYKPQQASTLCACPCLAAPYFSLNTCLGRQAKEAAAQRYVIISSQAEVFCAMRFSWYKYGSAILSKTKHMHQAHVQGLGT